LTTRLLIAARLEARDATVHTKRVGVEPIIDDVLTRFRARNLGRKTVVELTDDTLTLCCERPLILLLLTEYIESACRYAETNAPVTIGAADAHGGVVFSVRSPGPAIPEEDRLQLFDRTPFACATQSAGAASGLAIAKRIAMLHGGNVWVTSDTREGTAFFAAIPTTQLRG
jgi:K+-sensing histidine kinase KdpD